MKLTKDGGYIKIEYEGGTFTVRQTKIIEWKEDAEKWERATNGTGYKEFTKYRLTYERLKKRIELIKNGSIIQKTPTEKGYRVECDPAIHEYILNELQKILKG